MTGSITQYIRSFPLTPKCKHYLSGGSDNGEDHKQVARRGRLHRRLS